MSASADRGFLDALTALSRALDETGARAMIIGGVAVIAHGVPRLTVDIDATVDASRIVLDVLAATLGRHHIEPRTEDAAAFARQHQVFLAIHRPSSTPVDLSLAWLPFEDAALEAAQPIEYAGVHIRIPRPEDLVIYKLIAARPQDLDDAEGLLVLHGGRMNLQRVREMVTEFAALLDDRERPATLARLLRKVGLEA